MSQNLKKFIATQSALLGERGLDSPKLSVELLICHILGCERSELLKRLLLAPASQLAPEEEARIIPLLVRRQSGEPVAYITGHKEFYGRDFAVNKSTLIPRPETEMLVEAALNFAKELELDSDQHQTNKREAKNVNRLFADLGTGSGCLAVTLAAELPTWKGVALDISPEALRTAKQNAQTHQVRERLLFCRADLTHSCFKSESLDVVVANPPYISEADLPELSPEVVNFEPHSALFSKNQGLALPEACIKLASSALKPGGVLLMEFGYAQGIKIENTISNNQLFTATIVKDLACLDRMLFAVKKTHSEKKPQLL